MSSACCAPVSSPIFDEVKDYYGRVLENTASLKTSACTSASRPHALVRAALAKVRLRSSGISPKSPPTRSLTRPLQVPAAVRAKYYGCGSAVPLGIHGLSILDLGSGSGQDCYVASVLVGPSGRVTGIDMTEEQLAVARDNIGTFAATLGTALLRPAWCTGLTRHAHRLHASAVLRSGLH